MISLYLNFLFKAETSFIEAGSDPSDRTLIRVLRSEFDEEEEGQTSLKARKPRKGKLIHGLPLDLFWKAPEKDRNILTL